MPGRRRPCRTRSSEIPLFPHQEGCPRVSLAAMSNLHAQIEALATTLAKDILAAVRQGSLADLFSELKTAPARVAVVPAPALTKAPRSTAPAKAKGSGKAKAKAKDPRIAYRTPADIAATVAKIVALVATEKNGLRAEQIRATLGLLKAELPRPIREALAKNLLRRKGVKRATTYFAV